MRLSLTLPVIASHVAAVLAAPQNLDLDMVADAPDPTYTQKAGVTAQLVSYDPQSIAAQATAAVSSVEVVVSDVLSGTAVLKRDVNKRTACATQPTGASSYASAPTDPSAWATYAPFSAAASAGATPSGYTNEFTNLAASNNAYGYLGFTTLQSYDVNTCSKKCDAIFGCMSFNLYFERDPSLEPGAGCTDPAPVTVIKCVFWGGPINKGNAVNTGETRSSFKVLIAGSNGYTNNTVVAPPGFDTPEYFGDAAINAPYDGQGYNTLAGSTIFTQGVFNAGVCADYCNAQTKYNAQHPAKDGSPPKVCHFFNTFILYLKQGNNKTPQGQYCTIYTETWNSTFATNAGQYRGTDQYVVEYSYGYSLTGSPGVVPKVGDKPGAIYQAAVDMKYYPTSLTSVFQPFCSSVLSYTAPLTTTTAVVTITPTSLTTQTVVVNAKRAASTIPTPAVLSKYPATVVSSACSLIVTSPTVTSVIVQSTTTTGAPSISTVVVTSTTMTRSSAKLLFKRGLEARKDKNSALVVARDSPLDKTCHDDTTICQNSPNAA
ncbi:hypothetical protein E4T39_04003 [Aureobasidium subglaciale]|nr:hypothetical protein E4T39_04003 [Aureobasidium subglaciale]